MSTQLTGSSENISRAIASSVVGLLIVIGLLAVVQHYFVQLSGVVMHESDGFAVQFARYSEHASMEFLHLVPSFLFFTIAPLQFIRRIRSHHPRVHRILGRVYVMLGLTSGLLGLLISIVFPFGGRLETLLVMPFGLFFLYAVSRGFLLARARRIVQHRAWMIRGLAAALSISLQRVILLILMANTPQQEMSFLFSIAIALATVLALGVAELYVRYVPPPQAYVDNRSL